ncbi:MAG TPA: hypothetical protein PLI18_06725 [Pirellulaceae bacterium]|nr:hypothetical protein [Pirellulaceae bacterium]
MPCRRSWRGDEEQIRPGQTFVSLRGGLPFDEPAGEAIQSSGPETTNAASEEAASWR